MKKFVLIASLIFVFGCERQEPNYDNVSECQLRESQQCPDHDEGNICEVAAMYYCECLFGDEEKCEGI
tara:strand:+ start:58 stop:261 length:204 start_codon:yes stop_codon:yes gene_type:complete